MADRASQSSDALNLELAQLLSKKAGKRLRTTNRFAAFTPLEYQRDWFSYPEPIGALILPNQSGKSTIGAIKTLTGCLGVAPAAISGKPVPPHWPMGLCAGKKYAAAGATFQTITERTILPKLREYMSDDMLVKTRRKQGFETTFHFVSGASLVLMSYEQRVKDFEGGNFDGFWFDEPPPKDIFYAVRRGQMATRGWALITATPLTEPWMLDDLILPSQSLACAECSGGDTPHAEIVSEQPNHGLVYVPEPIDMCSNCVLAGSRVSGRFTGGLKAFYAGPAVEIETRHGNRLRVTAQHPVLTTGGIVPAGSLHKGVGLLRERCEGVNILAGRQEEEQDAEYPTVEEMFDALGARGRGVCERALLDLDGDERFIASQEIDAVGLLVRSPERGLVRDGYAHQVGNLALVMPDPSLAMAAVGGESGTPAAGGPGSAELSLHGLAIMAQGAPAEPSCIGLTAQLDAPLPKAALKGLRIASDFARQLLQAFPGQVALDQCVNVRHFNYVGHVYDFSTDVGYFASDSILVRNCRQCNGGYLDHNEIQSFLASITDDAQRMARKHGTFLNYATLEFGYVNDADNVVDDFRPPDAWPLVEVVDPAPKRGLHVKWFTCDEHDRWYNTHAARIPVAGGFRGMAKQVYAHRQEVGRHPDLALMDPRGGHHRMVGTDGIEDWFQGFRKEGLVYTPAIAPSVENGTVQTLHDWLKPAYDPSKGELSVPRLRFCKRLRTLKNGPLWAYERFSWNPQASLRKREYEQAGKDWVDCDMYLAMWVERMKLTHRKLVAEDAPRRRSLAASYAVKPQVPGTSRGAGRPPWVPKSLARSYASRPGDWIHRIRS